jgi:hypothetical protein
VKFGDAELLGVPTIVIVGRGAADGVVELGDRRSGERTELPATELVERLADRAPARRAGRRVRLPDDAAAPLTPVAWSACSVA